MQLEIESGKYVLAVSGGVDSMVLLDVLAEQAKSPSSLELVVAHFNHGIRAASKLDEGLVRKTATDFKLPIEIGYGKLGAKASEATARQARYKFLGTIRRKYAAQAIVTAHHQDDLIETAFINLLRGTGVQGLVAIRSNKKVLRPLIDVPKTEILQYAKQQRLKWRDDETNAETEFLRNYIRHKIVPKLSSKDRGNLLASLDKVENIQNKKNSLIATLSQLVLQENQIDRLKFNNLPASVSDELMYHWLNKANNGQTSRKEIRRLSNQLKTAQIGQRFRISKKLNLEVKQKTALLRTTD